MEFHNSRGDGVASIVGVHAGKRRAGSIRALRAGAGLTLRGVGHHMLMVVGKAQFMKLFRDRANRLGDDFVLKTFMDEFYASGFIPVSLIRWEMTGYDDEMKKLWQP